MLKEIAGTRAYNILKKLELCQIHHCPMFATVALSNSLTKTEYENVTFGANANQVSLADDQIRHHILIAGSNFVAVPKRDSVEVDMSKFMSHKGEKNE